MRQIVAKTYVSARCLTESSTSALLAGALLISMALWLAIFAVL